MSEERDSDQASGISDYNDYVIPKTNSTLVNKPYENNNEGKYHDIMNPNRSKGKGANIALFIIFLLILLPLNGYAIYSSFGEIYHSIADANINTGDSKTDKEIKDVQQTAAASIAIEMTVDIAIVCFLLLYCIAALIRYLSGNSQKRKGEHIIFLISCFLIFVLTLRNSVPLGIMVAGEDTISTTGVSGHMIATFASQILAALVTFGIIIAYIAKPNSVLN